MTLWRTPGWWCPPFDSGSAARIAGAWTAAGSAGRTAGSGRKGRAGTWWGWGRDGTGPVGEENAGRELRGYEDEGTGESQSWD